MTSSLPFARVPKTFLLGNLIHLFWHYEAINVCSGSLHLLEKKKTYEVKKQQLISKYFQST